MKKIYKSLSSLLITTLPTLSIIACNKQIPTTKPMIAPNWIQTMIKQKPTNIEIGYDHYQLVNKHNSSDNWNQYNWINLDKNQEMYIYLPTVNNLKQATKVLNLKDSAQTNSINMVNPIDWKQIDDNTYTNTNFITEDTSVGDSSLMDQNKFDQILNSSKSKTWTPKEMESFKKYGSLLATTSLTDQNWWNANGWECLLNNKKEFQNDKNKYSQRDIYDKWIAQEIIGMNVPLSLIEENSFILKTTTLNHVFYLQSMPKETWINNNGNPIVLLCPLWGITLQISDNKQTVFETPQFIHLNNSFHYSYQDEKGAEKGIIKYLKDQSFNSFNSEETTDFKNNFIA